MYAIDEHQLDLEGMERFGRDSLTNDMEDHMDEYPLL